MSFLHRFKQRKILSPVLNVPFPRTREATVDENGVEVPAIKPRFNFQISRFPTEEMTGLIVTLKRQFGEAEVDEAAYGIAYNIAFFDLLKRHIKGWTYHKEESEDDFPFSKENVKALDDMDYMEAVELILSFLESAKADEEKKRVISQ